MGAADEFLYWIKAGGKPMDGLLTRRKAERELFLSGSVVLDAIASVITSSLGAISPIGEV